MPAKNCRSVPRSRAWDWASPRSYGLMPFSLREKVARSAG